VLDVAAGTGNVAVRAAEAGAQVVASDLTPENFDAGRREARARGVELEWVEADAEALPFGDGDFDVVTSSFGAMFAPDHQAVADELVRVCQPGGTIGMANFTPEGLGAKFFDVFAPYMPPPPLGALPPAMWGSEEHVRELFGDRVASLELGRREYVERAAGPGDYCEFFKATFGPVIAVYASLADHPARAADLDRAFLEFAMRSNRGAPGGPAEYPYEYLLVIARKRA
jgi:2-polyprenyl-6-hydroxyphenyl methylase/3-demethylubiquinone-9 3-methyltransferase